MFLTKNKSKVMTADGSSQKFNNIHQFVERNNEFLVTVLVPRSSCGLHRTSVLLLSDDRMYSLVHLGFLTFNSDMYKSVCYFAICHVDCFCKKYTCIVVDSAWWIYLKIFFFSSQFVTCTRKLNLYENNSVM